MNSAWQLLSTSTWQCKGVSTSWALLSLLLNYYCYFPPPPPPVISAYKLSFLSVSRYRFSQYVHPVAWFTMLIALIYHYPDQRKPQSFKTTSWKGIKKWEGAFSPWPAPSPTLSSTNSIRRLSTLARLKYIVLYIVPGIPPLSEIKSYVVCATYLTSALRHLMPPLFIVSFLFSLRVSLMKLGTVFWTFIRVSRHQVCGGPNSYPECDRINE